MDNLAIAVARSQPLIVGVRFVDEQWSARTFAFAAGGYLLERSADLHEWHAVVNGVREDGLYLRLIDENPSLGDGFYRLSR